MQNFIALLKYELNLEISTLEHDIPMLYYYYYYNRKKSQRKTIKKLAVYINQIWTKLLAKS